MMMLLLLLMVKHVSIMLLLLLLVQMSHGRIVKLINRCRDRLILLELIGRRLSSGQ